jgi:hypothetical protein
LTGGGVEPWIPDHRTRSLNARVGGERRHVRIRLAQGEVAGSQVAVGGEGTDLLVVSRLVKNFTVTAGAVLQRRIGQVSAVADMSFTIPAG